MNKRIFIGLYVVELSLRHYFFLIFKNTLDQENSHNLNNLLSYLLEISYRLEMRTIHCI